RIGQLHWLAARNAGGVATERHLSQITGEISSVDRSGIVVARRRERARLLIRVRRLWRVRSHGTEGGAALEPCDGSAQGHSSRDQIASGGVIGACMRLRRMGSGLPHPE